MPGFFIQCGGPAWLMLLLGLPALALALAAVLAAGLSPRVAAWLAVSGMVAALVTTAVGIVGTQMGRARVDSAVSGASLNARDRENIRELGYQEAQQCTNMGLGIGSFPLLLAAIALTTALVRKRAPGTQP